MPATISSRQNDPREKVDFFECVDQLNGNEISTEVRKKRISQFIRERGARDLDYGLQILCQNPQNCIHVNFIGEEFIRNINLDDVKIRSEFVKTITENQWHKSPPIGYICVQILLAIGEKPDEAITQSFSLSKQALLYKIRGSQSHPSDEIACCNPNLGLTLHELLVSLQNFRVESSRWHFFGWSRILAMMGYDSIDELCNALSKENEWLNTFILCALEMIRKPISAKKIAPFLFEADKDNRELALILLRDYSGKEAIPYIYNFINKESTNLEIYEIGSLLIGLASKGDEGIRLLEKLVMNHPDPKIYKALMYEIDILKQRAAMNESMEALFQGLQQNKPHIRVDNSALKVWRNRLSEFPSYSSLMRKYFASLYEAIRKLPNAFNSDESEYGLFIPIIDENWGIKNANDTKYGAFITLPTRFIIVDLISHQVHSWYYDEIECFSYEKNIFKLELSNNRNIQLELKLPFTQQLIWSATNLGIGLANSFSRDPANRIIGMMVTRDNMRQANAELRQMVDYLETVFQFFTEIFNSEDTKDVYV